MIVQVIFTITLILLSVKSIIFLKAYITLSQSGAKTKAKVIAFENSRYLMILNAAIPKIEFHTEENHTIIEKPVYSWFMELNNYQLDKTCVAFHDKTHPERFVVKSNIEFLTNFVITIIALVSLISLLMAFI